MLKFFILIKILGNQKFLLGLVKMEKYGIMILYMQKYTKTKEKVNGK